MALKGPPTLIPYWFHSLESDSKHKETPNIRIEFSKNDSDHLEKAYQKLLEYENGNLIEKPPETVDVLDDLLFEVDIPKRKLSPIYWKGKSYEVVRGTWFYATDMFKFLACDEELSKQIEEGYQKAQPWLLEPPKINAEKSKTFIDFEDKRNFKLTGSYVGQSITYSGPNSAWLLSTNIASQLARAVMTKITSNDNVGGTRLIRGYAEVEKWKKRNEEEIKRSKSKRGRNKRKKLVYEDEDARSIEGEGSSNYTSPDGSPIQSKYPEKSSTEFSINNYAVNSDKNENDYRYNKIEHLVFVVHGIGEKFAEDKSVATIEKSVNDIRKTAKEVANLYFCKDKNNHQKNIPLPSYPTTSENAYKNIYVPEGTGVQFIPVNWRRNMNLDRYHQKRRRKNVNIRKSLSNLEKKLEASKNEKKEKENTSNTEAEKESSTSIDVKKSSTNESSLNVPTEKHDSNSNSDDDLENDSDDDDDYNFPKIEDIMLESIPMVRTIVTDLALDVLLYMTPRYYQQMITILTSELNRLYNLFMKHHPDFKGKVSLFGHSLGSQLCFDILCHQIPKMLNKDKIDVVKYNRLTPYGNEVLYNFKQLDFPVHTFFAVGSPIGLFTILSDRSIRFFDWNHPTTEGLSSNEVLVPIVKKMYNIFHPSDPVAHRIEPLIVRKKEFEKNGGEDYKPNPIPYSKGGLTGTVREIQGYQKDLTMKSMKLFGNVYNVVQAFMDTSNKNVRSAPVDEEESFDGRDLKNININGRLDYMIQAQILDNQYLAAIPAHSSYWNDQDTISFLLAELYRDMSFDG